MIDRVQWVSHKNLNDFYFRENFRTDFNQLGSMRTILPKAKMLVLTATASPPVIKKMKEVLLLNDDYVLVSVSPNRANIYLEKIERLANGTGKKAHKAILVPLAEELNLLREKFPLTVIYMKLECMIIAVRVFSDIVGNVISESGDMRLFNVFHSETTPAMKSKVIEELGKKNSYIRVVFATTALGMYGREYEICPKCHPYYTIIIHGVVLPRNRTCRSGRRGCTCCVVLQQFRRSC